MVDILGHVQIAANVHALPKCRNRIPTARPRRNFFYLRRITKVQ